MNEGFAQFVQFIGTDYVEPGTGKMDRFVIEVLAVALVDDALESSHPISIPVQHPDEINSVFDNIAYSKGDLLIILYTLQPM